MIASDGRALSHPFTGGLAKIAAACLALAVGVFPAAAARAIQQSEDDETVIRITPLNPAAALAEFLGSGEYDAERDLELSISAANREVEKLNYSDARRVLRDAWKRMKREGAQPLTLAQLHSAIADVERLRGRLKREVTHRRLVIARLEDVYGEGSLEAESARIRAAAAFARDSVKRIKDHPNSSSFGDRILMAYRFAKKKPRES